MVCTVIGAGRGGRVSAEGSGDASLLIVACATPSESRCIASWRW
jgi:hypothetical protein